MRRDHLELQPIPRELTTKEWRRAVELKKAAFGERDPRVVPFVDYAELEKRVLECQTQRVD